MFYIKRYCKKVDITDIGFIRQCCYDYLDGKRKNSKSKWKRDDVNRLFVRFSEFSFQEVKEIVNSGEKEKLYPAVDVIAEHISKSIKENNLNLRPIKYFEKIDGMNHKKRIIGVQEPLHQIYDYVVVAGLQEMFDKKIGAFQCASLPGKGQSYGKRHIEKWVKEKKTIYFVKGDITQCFPSIPHSKLKRLLKRDVKNDTLLWLTYELIDMFEQGLSIGSYLSQYLSNYYLSYAYHYASTELFKIRKTKRCGNVRVRLINHVLFYMDDFLLTGNSKKDLKKAMKMLIKYIYGFLGLIVKATWKICKLSDKEPIDMMGFVFRKGITIIRTKIFLKTRRYYLKVKKLLKKGFIISELLARRCISAYGWYKNTDSYKIRKKLGIDEIHKKCKKIVGFYTKLKRGGYDGVILQQQIT